MGGNPYWYVVKYESDIDSALQKLREVEFKAGRYYPAMDFPVFPIDPDAPAPGAQHASIDAAREAADADGTQSILDLDHVSPVKDFCGVFPLDDGTLTKLFGTTSPTREMVEKSVDLFEELDRGEGAYVVLQKDGKPHEIFFAGISID